MPASLRLRVGVVTFAQLAIAGLATRAYAAPSPTPTPSRLPSDDPCDLLIGPAKQYCNREGTAPNGPGAGLAPNDPADALNPSPPSQRAAPTPQPGSSANSAKR